MKTKSVDHKKHPVVVQKWEESEAGCGTRPDGYSLHLSHEDAKAFVADYWARMPDEVQDEYSRPCGTPYMASIDDATLAKIKASKNGTRHLGQPPGSGGTDGWVAVREH